MESFVKSHYSLQKQNYPEISKASSVSTLKSLYRLMDENSSDLVTTNEQIGKKDFFFRYQFPIETLFSKLHYRGTWTEGWSQQILRIALLWLYFVELD